MARNQTRSFLKVHVNAVPLYVNMDLVTATMNLAGMVNDYPNAKAVLTVMGDEVPVYVDETAEEIIYGQGNRKRGGRGSGGQEKETPDNGDRGRGDREADRSDTGHSQGHDEGPVET